MEKEKFLHGLIVSGTIITKNKYPGKDGKPDRFGIDVAVQGIRQLLAISVKPEVWGSLQERSDWRGAVVFSVFKGQVYFQAV